MKMKNLISMLLAVMMMLGSVAMLAGAFPTYAAGETTEEEKLKTYEVATQAATSNAYKTTAEKVTAEMALGYTKLLAANGSYRLYCNIYTGEVYYQNTITGDFLTTNPSDLSGTTSSMKPQLLSQLSVKYMDTTGAVQTYNSYVEAAQRGQINVKQIRNGIRVEYTVGRTDTNYMIPGWITADRFESLILEPFALYMLQILADEAYTTLEEVRTDYDFYIAEFAKLTVAEAKNYEYSPSYYAIQALTNGVPGYSAAPYRYDALNSKAYQITHFQYMKMLTSYARQDPNNATPSIRNDIQNSYKICKEIDEDTGVLYVIYTIDDTLPDKAQRLLESYVRTYCTETYNYDEKAKDTEETGYVSKQADPAYFRMSLEYTIASDGTLSVRLPANGIRYDSTNFTMLSVDILQFLGAGTVYEAKNNTATNEGYLFYPDGSGAILEYATLNKQGQSASLTNKVYGEDYAYYTVADKHQEEIRLPVFGIVDSTVKQENSTSLTYDSITGAVSNITTTNSVRRYSGFVAYLTEGETLSSLTLAFGGGAHNYATVHASFTPAPSDSYTLKDSISISTDSSEWTVVSEKKFLGSFMMKVKMLTDPTVAKNLSLTNTYDASWAGMAAAYRDYLWNGETLLESDSENTLPLYIESFGSVETTEKFLSIPITVDKALTSFGDVVTIYEELSEKGVTDINFKLTGFANGGMYATYPNRVNWMNSVGGIKGYNSLLAYADSLESGNLGIYPEFEFSYVSTTELFDGVDLKDDAGRTVDNRYASKQFYDCVYQEYTSYFDILIAPDAILSYYNKFKTSFEKAEGITGISASSLGEDLNSSFYDKDPYNREDAKSYVKQILADMEESYGSVMTGGGNAYAIPSSDHILGVPLDSSNYKYATRSVPFFGMVLHGYVNYAGSAMNEAGDSNYHILRSIENGASPYYILSYANTTILKEDEMLSKYYSIRYDIWKEDLVEQYTLMNDAIGDLQNYLIVDEIELIAERDPDKTEMNRYRAQMRNLAVNALTVAISQAETEKIRELRFRLEMKRYFESEDPITAAQAIVLGEKTAAEHAEAVWSEAFVAILRYIAASDAFNTADITDVEAFKTASMAILDEVLSANYADVANEYKQIYNAEYAAASSVLAAERELYLAEREAAMTAAIELNATANADALNNWKNREVTFRTQYKAIENSDPTTAYNTSLLYLKAARVNIAYIYKNTTDLSETYSSADTSVQKKLLLTALETVVTPVYGNALSDSARNSLSEIYDAYSAGSSIESTIGSTVTVTVDRDAVLESIYDAYATILSNFTAEEKNDFREAMTEVVDNTIATYYANSVRDYINSRKSPGGESLYGTLTANEYLALKDAIAYFYVAKTEDVDQVKAEAFVLAHLNNSNNDTRPLTETQKSVIAAVIDYMTDTESSFYGDYIATVETVGEIAFDRLYTDSDAESESYVSTAFTVSDDSVLMVVYENREGTERYGFILNFNVFDVTVSFRGNKYQIGSYGFARIALD